ncbi:MAG: PD-(D/E)XK nuclease family protein [Bacteroidales bacterium]
MEYFLEHLAKHIYESYSKRFEKQCIVFPNRRAGLYFMKYLSGIIKKPVWSPSIKTINELFSCISSLEVAENEILIFELYKTYKEISKRLKKKPEPFDEFYFWGEMLLNDFDDVDKYFVDAGKLFSNLSDLKRIDTELGGLTEEQIEIIRQFWINFNSGRHTGQKEIFLELWKILPELYVNFRNNLRNKGLAYEGMIFREVAENCISGENLSLPWETFHFIGFNALNRCEKELFKYLKNNGKAKFYWDYDESYINKSSSHTAGYFIRENLRLFGNDMPDGWNYKTLLSASAGEIKRKIISTSTDIAQVKLVPELLKESGELDSDEAHHTAIILVDENLLLPLLNSIPDSVKDVNITMGYPLKFSPVYSFLRLLLLLQRNSRKENEEILFEYSDVSGLLQHSFLSDEAKYQSGEILNSLIKEGKRWIPSSGLCRTDSLKMIFRKIESPVEIASYLKTILGSFYLAGEDETEFNIRNKLHNEFIFRALQVINRLENLTRTTEVEMKTETWLILLDRILRNISVPFSGEPLSGIQIMGLLETRTLDFRNIIMLSVNEGVLPRSSTASSYIPYNLREAFGLPVIRHQDSIYAYYFYRLLHRAENVIFVYNSNAEGLKTGEMSRLLMQLVYLYENPPDILSTGYNIGVKHLPGDRIERSDKHTKILEKIYFENKAPLSPNAINTWISCRMKFYYRYVCGLKEPDRIISADDPAAFGEILHQIMKELYSNYSGEILEKNDIEKLAGGNDIDELVNKKLRSKFHSNTDAVLSGTEQIIASILSYYVRLILNMDKKVAPFKIFGLEYELSVPFEMEYNGNKAEISIGGIIDRIDEKSGSFRIVDYKTGKVKKTTIESINSLFDEKEEDRGQEWLQVLTYCEIFLRKNSLKVFPLIYSLRKLTDEEYIGMLKIKNNNTEIVIDDYSRFREDFSLLLRKTVSSIFDKNEPFRMTEKTKICENCLYRELCNR